MLPRKLSLSGVALFTALLSALSSNLPAANLLSDQKLPAGIPSPLTKPTPAEPLQRLIQPWEAQRALVVALTPSFITNQPKALETYLELFRIAAPYLEILIIIPTGHPEIRMQVNRLLSVNPADHAVRKRISYLDASNATVWARDYLPQYAISTTGGMVMLDSGRINFTTDPAEALKLLADDQAHATSNYYKQMQRALDDDVTPFYLANHARSHYQYDMKTVRPPLYLDGGDFITLGSNEVILSESTVRYNGGNRDEFIPLVKEYFGLEKVHILKTLPGITIDHLDFIVMAADESTLLVAAPPPSQDSPQAYDVILAEQVTETLTKNRHYLDTHFPHKKIITVPMPPLMRTPRGEVINSIAQILFRELCDKYGIAWADIAESPLGSSKQKRAERKFERSLEKEFGKIDFNNTSDIDKLAHAILGESLAQMETKFVRQSVPYRTYLNATFLRNADGQTAVIIPRYKPRHEGEIEIFAQMETEVLAAYRQAFPTADLHWLDSDALIGNFGAVHCITHTIPDWDAIRNQTVDTTPQ